MVQVDPGLWCQIGSPDLSGRPALFLDRDGVVITDTNYLGRPEDLHMIEGAALAIARCNALGIPIVMVTNQSGIARGYYDWSSFCAVQRELCSALALSGARLDAVLACAYHIDGTGQFRLADHPWRKPNPGMILEAGSRMKLDLSRSWIVGDRVSDIAAGRAAGLCGAVLVHGPTEDRLAASALADETFSVDTAPDLAYAIEVLLSQNVLSLATPISNCMTS